MSTLNASPNTALNTERLRLRPITAADVPAMVPLLDNFAVAKNLTPVAHPYTAELGHAFVVWCERQLAVGASFNWSIFDGDGFVGICTIGNTQGRFNLGYWLGEPYWGRGYAAEAARRAVRFAFEELGESALVSGYYADNPASGRVLAKLGFEPAGTELLHCVSRDATVVCNRVWLAREDFMQKMAA